MTIEKQTRALIKEHGRVETKKLMWMIINNPHARLEDVEEAKRILRHMGVEV